MSRGAPRALVLALLFVLPAAAHAPAWREERLLGPGDGTFLHYPMRAAAWSELRRGRVPGWNPAVFGGTPLLSHYRAGAFYPLMPLLAQLRPFPAFQLLVLFSLGAAAVLTFLYLERLGAHAVGAFAGGLAFALGPYLVNHLGDTDTVVAAPLLPLVLLAAEAHARRAGAARAAGLALALALLLLAGSPVAVRAGIALLLGRLILLHARRRRDGPPRLRASLLAVAAGFLLAAPQLLPTLFALRDAGRGFTDVAGVPGRFLPGLTGLVLQYVSHTPAPVFALAALPLAVTRPPVRALLLALLLCLTLRHGRGPLSAPGSLALAFDFTLALLAGLCLSAFWEARTHPEGRRLRAYMLFAAVAAALALSAAAAALGPLPQRLAGAAGVLALTFIVQMAGAHSRDPALAGAFLLPLTASLLLQPLGREAWAGAPTRRELAFGTSTHEAVDRALGPRKGERLLTVAREWPRAALDLGFGNLASVLGRSSLHGYDPLVPRRVREDLGLDAASLLPGAFFREPPALLERLGVRFVQAPDDALLVSPDAQGLGERFDLLLRPGRTRMLPVPSGYATSVRLATWMADAVDLENGTVVAQVAVRLASGRDLVFPFRAGRETAEWAYDRADVRARVRHAEPPQVARSSGPGSGFEGNRYLAVLDLGGRYRVTGLRLDRRPGPGRLYLHAAGTSDGPSHRGLSLVSAWLSDTGVLRELPAAPTLRLFAVRGGAGLARVVESARVVPGEVEVRRVLRADGSFDPRREALLSAREAARAGPPLEGARSGRAEVVRAEGGRLDVRAEGPGLLVIGQSFDPGWAATVGGAPAPVLRANGAQLAVPLPSGPQRVALRYHPPGLPAGAGLALAALCGLLLALVRERGSPRGLTARGGA